MTHWVIMPFYGALDLTRQAVRDVLQQSLPVELLLIDTHPTAESRALCRDLRLASSHIWSWHHDPPLPSLAATWNYALNTIWAGGATEAWVVNNDVRLPHRLYQDLLEVQAQTGGWFVTAANVRDAWYDGMLGQSPAITPSLLATRGGPDFSCFLITRECHQWFQFDEQFIPAYFEDNDYHRRLELAGFGDRIFSVSLPYLHYGSGTLQHNEGLRKDWGPKFDACRQYYARKWGGLPHQETYQVPFQAVQRDGDLGFADFRILLLGQGRREVSDDVLLFAYQQLYRDARP